MTRRSKVLVLLGIVLLAFNLRPATAIGPVLDEVRAAFSMSGASAGLLTSLPVLAFAGFGALAPRAAARTGAHRVILIALLAVVVGLFGRATTRSETLFLTFSMLALGGMAMANVLLPSLIKLHFPTRIGRMTAVYTTALSIGNTAALTLTVPISQAADSWRVGLGTWGALALIAAIPWLGLVRHDRTTVRTPSEITFTQVLRTPLGLAMAGFFGIQSLQAYVIFGWFATLWRDAGFSAGEAGALVGLLSALAIPLSFVVPPFVARQKDQRWVLLAIMLCYPVGYVGLILAPHDLAIVWAVIIGIGTITFPVILLMIGLRSRTPAGTAALSSVTQSVGYLIAALGPFGFGLIHDLTDGWTVPVLALLALTLPLVLLGLYVARPVFVEDQI